MVPQLTEEGLPIWVIGWTGGADAFVHHALKVSLALPQYEVEVLSHWNVIL